MCILGHQLKTNSSKIFVVQRRCSFTKIMVVRRNKRSTNGDGNAKNNSKRQKKMTANGDNNNNKNSSKLDVTDDLICAITKELPYDPVYGEDGRIYERWAIERHIAACPCPSRNLKSPHTNKKMGTKLTPALQHKNIIEALIENGTITGDLLEQWNERLDEHKVKDDLMKRANNGDVQAMLDVGTSYYHGTNGFRMNEKTAFQWLKKAHDDHRVVIATAMLGYMHLMGQGVKKNVSQGIMYTTQAAQRGSDMAMAHLGDYLANGKYGLTVDQKEAIFWLKKAVDPKCKIQHMVEVGLSHAASTLRELEKNDKSN